ncbi:MAG: 5-formyltetrahydrofolate cyclo-ligase family protein [Pseudonocardiales bacterium]|nr:5-formyltetrahydrofolate cyclo-ligase family protein [Pseudonocardiales bacterium]
MPELSAVPDYNPLRLRRSSDSAPLYRQVCDGIEAMAMAAPLGDETPLPPEGSLLTRFGVSRGTLRRATDELARQGLLRIEPGRGTFVDQATKVRWLVWSRLLEVARPDSRFDLDLSRFVPDFDGREHCDDRLTALAEHRAAATIFIAPDNSLETYRKLSLADGKRLIVPTFGMRRGFVLLDGRRIAAGDRAYASTLDGMERIGQVLSLEELREVGPIGLVVTGAVAVTGQGLHFGGGDGYFDLEWGLLRHFGLVTARTTVAASVHSCQVLDAMIRPVAHDAVVDVIITPEQTRICTPSLPKPDGIFWDEIRTSLDQAGPYVQGLLNERQPIPAMSRRPLPGRSTS